MVSVNNFEQNDDFFNENMPVVEQRYFEHFYLIKVYERLLNREFKVLDAFTIVDGDLSILFLSTEAGAFIYGDKFNDEMLEKLHERIVYYKYTNFSFAGTKVLLMQLFSRFEIGYTIDKDRIIYETSATLRLKKKHLGKTVKSRTADYNILAQHTYDYSLEEWGERKGRGIDYVQRLVTQAIYDGVMIQYDTSYGIGCIAQILNLENDMPVIGSLYTPPEHRKKGYATMLVHALTKKLLEDGFDKCGIISEANNPATNKIFVEVGYKPIYEHLSLRCPEFKSAI